MKLSVIIPVYNEESTIGELLDMVDAVDLGDVGKEVVIVNDCSTDGTAKVLSEKKHLDRKDIHLPENRGKGYAVRRGIREAAGDIILIQDADLEVNPAEYPDLIAPIIRGEADVVYGSRFLKRNQMRLISRAANLTLTTLTNVLYGAHLTDMETCFKVFRAETIRDIPLRADGFDFEPEITAKLLKRKVRIHELPVDYNPRSYAEGKKIHWKDGLKAAACLFRYRFTD